MKGAPGRFRAAGSGAGFLVATATAAIAVTGGCAAIIGLGDVPNPIEDDASPDATTDHSVPVEGGGADQTIRGSDARANGDASAGGEDNGVDGPLAGDAGPPPSNDGGGGAEAGPPFVVGTPCDAGDTCCARVYVDTRADSNNCGRCGHGCQGGTCWMGACQPVTLASQPFAASSTNHPSGIAVNSAGVYWTNYATSGTVMQAPLDGGTPGPAAANQRFPQSIAADSTTIFWTNFGGGTVMRLTLGGTPTMLASGQIPNGITVDAARVYWTSGDSLSTGTVLSAPLAGGTPTTLASGQTNPTGVAVDSTSVYWVNAGNYAPRVGALMKAPLGGGTPVMLASGLSNPESVAVDSTRVYWTNMDDGTVMQVALNGGTPIPLASNQVQPSGLAVDSTGVYWTNLDSTGASGGKVNRLPLDGGNPTTLASAQPAPSQVALDSTSVYWVNSNAAMNDGCVMKVAKP
jgi:sugar lactone lactonase YvrE